MQYVSTRGQAPVLGFDDVLLAGLASDGGLYVPESIPRLDEMPDASSGYAAVASQVMRPFVGNGVIADQLDALCEDAYSGFADPRVAPLTEVDDELFLLELFWGPTLSFKDYALQLVGRMFDAVLTDRGSHVLVLGATSGDTGSAAIASRRRSGEPTFVPVTPWLRSTRSTGLGSWHRPPTTGGRRPRSVGDSRLPFQPETSATCWLRGSLARWALRSIA